MAIMNFVVLCLIFVSTCLAEQNQTGNLEEQSNIQKREKQFLIDDEGDGPSVKRDERQSSPSRTNLSENDVKILQNSLNVKLRPKIIPVQLKPVAKPKVIGKPLNVRIDAAPKRIPTKIPIVLKTAKVVPAPAHALRLKMMEARKNESLLKQDAAVNNENKIFLNNEDHNGTKDAIPYSIEDKIIPNKNHEDTKHEVKQTFKPEKKLSNDCIDEDIKIDFSRNGKITENNDQKVVNDVKKKENKTLGGENNFRRVYADTNNTPVKVLSKPVYFYEDEVDTTPLLVKKRPKPEDQPLKLKDSSLKPIEIPITRNAGNKLTFEESKNQDADPDTVHISNGTHLISIKKLRDYDKPKTESRQHIEERIVNEMPIVEKPEPKPSSKETNLAPLVPSNNKKQVEKYTDIPNKLKNSGINQEKDPNDCILISNHDYQEIEEITTLAPPLQTNAPTITNAYDNRVKDSWNYLQNLYYNPYYPNIYNQYRRYYESQDPQIYKDTNEFMQNFQNPDYTQIFPDENEVVYNDFNQNRNYLPNRGENNCPDKPQENTLDKIWRTLKDVEIKIRNNNEDPVDIDIRRNILVDNFNNEMISNAPASSVTQPISINGYYNNQNSALVYPYYSPTYRYLH